jgi:hypothetical protein
VDFNRPAAVTQAPLPAFDLNDPGGLVPTTLPPEQIIPAGPNIRWWRGDAWGVTLPTAPALVKGCNTTPPTMVMSYLLPRYGQSDIDAILTGHAVRGYTHFHLDLWNALDAGLTPAQFANLIAYVQSWGFFTSAWGLGTSLGSFATWAAAQPYLQPYIQAITALGSAVAENHICLIGEELNSCTTPGLTGLDDIITHCVALGQPSGMLFGVHFTSNYPAWYGSDVSGPSQWWQKFIGKLTFLAWQGDPSDPAGTMLAHLWDSRCYLDDADKSFLATFFEYLGEDELYATPITSPYAQFSGPITEEYACLRGFEGICATRAAPNPGANPVAGFGGGGRYPNGTAL